MNLRTDAIGGTVVLTLIFSETLVGLCAMGGLVQIPHAAVESAKTAKQGAIVRIENVDLNALPMLDVEIKDAGGPQFLLSDKPEYFRTGNGIAMQEQVKPGVVRLYIYHVPTPGTDNKIISAVIENTGESEMRFRFLKRVFPQPGKDYHLIGKNGLLGFYNAKPQDEVRTLAPGARMAIDPQMDESVVSTDMLVHGFYEFEIDQPARVTVFQRDRDQDGLRVIDDLPKLPRVLEGHHPSGAGRGLFHVSERTVSLPDGQTFDTAGGAMQVVLADGKRDGWIEGVDSLTPDAPSPNKGNYGVMYRIRLRYTSSDGRGLALLVFNARSGARWCEYQASAAVVSEGEMPAGTVAIPADRVRYGGPPETVLLQRFAPAPADETREIELLWSPPGASCLPNPLILLPL
jgi:hypothetical protein